MKLRESTKRKYATAFPIDDTTKSQPKRKIGGKVRWRENGLLDVERKGKYLKTIAANAQPPLLCLPLELRNYIYEYALGGQEWKVRCGSYDDAPHVHNKQRQALSLLGVCRQIYSEAALLTFSLGTFSYRNRGTFLTWSKTRRPVERAAITTVHFWSLNVGNMLRWHEWLERIVWKKEELPGLMEIHVTVTFKKEPDLVEGKPWYANVKTGFGMVIEEKANKGAKALFWDMDREEARVGWD